MFFKSQAVFFALSFLSASLGRPLGSETPIKRVHKPVVVRAQVVRAQVVRVQAVARDASASASCNASCDTAVTRTVIVSGTATASAATTVTFGSPTSTASPSAMGNFGSCSIPQIEFGAGFNGRTETSFRPVDTVSYNHGSADDVTVITDFICSALVNTCNADATAQATCAKAQAAAAAETPEEGIDADAFNEVFGIQTNFKDVVALNSNGDPINGSTTDETSTSSSSTAEATSSTTFSLNSTSSASSSDASPTSDVSTASATHDTATSTAAAKTLITAITSVVSTEPAPTAAAGSNSDNLQTFTGALGGITAPTVVASGSQFQVENNSLIKNKADALTRSCSIQQNLCSDAANKAKNQGSLTVAACIDQGNTCNAGSKGARDLLAAQR